MTILDALQAQENSDETPELNIKNGAIAPGHEVPVAGAAPPIALTINPDARAATHVATDCGPVHQRRIGRVILSVYTASEWH